MRVALIPNSVALAHHLTMSVGPSGLALGLTLDVVVPVATASSSSVLTEGDVQRLIAMYKDDYARCWLDAYATVDIQWWRRKTHGRLFFSLFFKITQ